MDQDWRDIKSRFLTLTTDDWLEYGENWNGTTMSSHIGGSRDKTFIWCKSELFQELIDELRNNPNCSYSTSYNKDIINGVDFKYLSVLEKNAYESSIGEVLTGRVLNFFGIRTPYEVVVNKDSKLKMLSVDFEKDGYIFKTLASLGMDIRYDTHNTVSHLQNSLACLHESTSSPISKLDDKSFKKYKDKFIEDVLYSLLVRHVILGDIDCNEVNLGIEIGKEGDFYLMNFDYEDSFSHTFNKFFLDIQSLRTVVGRYFPKLLNRFWDKFDIFRGPNADGSKKVYEEIIDNCSCFKGVDLTRSKDVLACNIAEFVGEKEMEY